VRSARSGGGAAVISAFLRSRAGVALLVLTAVGAAPLRDDRPAKHMVRRGRNASPARWLPDRMLRGVVETEVRRRRCTTSSAGLGARARERRVAAQVALCARRGTSSCPSRSLPGACGDGSCRARCGRTRRR
jgi:hypothetical protein